MWMCAKTLNVYFEHKLGLGTSHVLFMFSNRGLFTLNVQNTASIVSSLLVSVNS